MCVRFVSLPARSARRVVALLTAATVISCSKPDDALVDINGVDAPTGNATAAPPLLTSSDRQARALLLRDADDRRANDKMMARVRRVMSGYLKDPASAQYAAVRNGRNGGICLRVNARNGYGAYVGMTPMIITQTDFFFKSGENYYDIAYLHVCASEQERRAARDEYEPEPTGEEPVADDFAEQANAIAEESSEEQSDPFANLE